MEKAYETIVYEKRDSIASITLNRPDSLNALNTLMLRELLDALKKAGEDQEVRCIILKGAGRGFCSGADLQELRNLYEKGEPPSLGENLRKMFNPIIAWIRQVEKPVIALINGVAAGAGMAIAMACDMKIASDRARFVPAFAKVGLIPDSGLSFFLPRLLGLSRAMELAFTGEGFDSIEAERLGVVNKVVKADELEKAGMELAAKLAKGPTKAYGLAKRAINRALGLSLEEALDYEAYMQEIAGRTRDHAEGVKAFIEKREPEFKGE